MSLPEELNLNKELNDLFLSHWYESEIQWEYVIPNFKEKVKFRTWAYPIEKKYQDWDKYIQSRFDVWITVWNNKEIYEAFWDIWDDLSQVLKRNLTNFTNNSIHPIISAFNDLEEDDYTLKKNWTFWWSDWNTYIWNYWVKWTESWLNLPENLMDKLQMAIESFDLNWDYHFVRFYYAQQNNEDMMIEFMIDNENKEDIEKVFLEKWNDLKIDFEHKEWFYSVRNFMILKKNNIKNNNKYKI